MALGKNPIEGKRVCLWCLSGETMMTAMLNFQRLQGERWLCWWRKSVFSAQRQDFPSWLTADSLQTWNFLSKGSSCSLDFGKEERKVKITEIKRLLIFAVNWWSTWLWEALLSLLYQLLLCCLFPALYFFSLKGKVVFFQSNETETKRVSHTKQGWQTTKWIIGRRTKERQTREATSGVFFFSCCFSQTSLQTWPSASAALTLKRRCWGLPSRVVVSSFIALDP